MADTFQIEIITPDRVFYTGETDFVEFTTTEGEMGVYKNHIPLTAVLAPGQILIHKGEETKEAALHAGFVEILEEKITFLAEIAEWPGEIDLARAEAARKRAEDRIAAHAADLDLKRAEIALKKSLIRISMAGK